MTAKRFTITGDRSISDHQKKRLYDLNDFDGMISVTECLNELVEENNKIKSILLKKVEELNDAYNKSAKAGMPTGGIIGELDSFEEICKIMEWIE